MKINLDLHKTELCEELNLFQKKVQQESPTLNVLKFIFVNN